MNSQPALSPASATRGEDLQTEPLIASRASRLNLLRAWRKRQTPTRIPYSCHAQLGRSGISGWPYGGGSTVRGMLRSIAHSSTVTMGHTPLRGTEGPTPGGGAVGKRERGTIDDRRVRDPVFGKHHPRLIYRPSSLEEDSMLNLAKVCVAVATLTLPFSLHAPPTVR